MKTLERNPAVQTQGLWLGKGKDRNMIAERTENQECNSSSTKVAMKNEMEMIFDAISSNESFARMTVAAFIAHLNLTLDEIADIKTAVSEAVTNAIIHGYENLDGYGVYGDKKPYNYVRHAGKVRMHCILDDEMLHIEVSDTGKGIENIEKAMEPLYTTRPELERSGMGFSFMEAFMDELDVESEPDKGTTVRMRKKINAGSWIDSED